MTWYCDWLLYWLIEQYVTKFGKVKLTFILEQAVKAQKGSRGIGLLFL